MGWEGHLLRKPVGWGDISTATGVGGPPYDLGNMIANGTLINKWALHKFVRLQPNYDTPIDISDYNTWITYMQSRVAKADGTGSAPFGLFVTPSQNLYDIIGTNDAPTIDWVYQRPPASGSFWRRSLDLAGYTDLPNVPINPPDELTYYKDSTNILVINTNQGEAGETSIPINALTTLDDYQLMVIFKNTSANPVNWKYAVMPTTIMRSIAEGETVINFQLPDSIGVNNNSASGYDAYIVGVSKNENIITGQWNTQQDDYITNFRSMIPLPLPQKTDCHFKLKVKDTAPYYEIYVSYIIFRTRDYKVQRLRFIADKFGQVPSGFSLVLNNIIIYDDDNNPYPLNPGDTVNLSFTSSDWDQATNHSHKEVDINVSPTYNINPGSDPYLTYSHVVSGSFTVIDGGGWPEYVD